MTPLRRALLSLGVAGIALGVPIAAITATSDHTDLRGLIAVLGLVVAGSFLGTGLYAWDQRPDNLTGPLMVALAFSWLLAGLSNSNFAGLYIGGVLLAGLPFAILTHLLFAFPSGRLQGRPDRLFVGLGYLVTTVMPPIGIVFFDPAVSDDCPECPANPLLIWDNQSAFNALVAFQSTLAAIVLGALIWHLLRRRRHAFDDQDERVRNAPVWWAGGATLLLVIAVLATNVGPEEGNFDDYLFAAALVLLATVPYAFLLGILRSKLWRADIVAEENVRLDAELQARLDELRESRARIVEAGYAERRRVERDLHDGAQQRLVALALDLGRVRAALSATRPPPPSCWRPPPVADSGHRGAARAGARDPPGGVDRPRPRGGARGACQAGAAAGARRGAGRRTRARRRRGGRVLRRVGGAHERGPPRARRARGRARSAGRRPAASGGRGRWRGRRRPDRRLRAARPGGPRRRPRRRARRRERQGTRTVVRATLPVRPPG